MLNAIRVAERWQGDNLKRVGLGEVQGRDIITGQEAGRVFNNKSEIGVDQ
jgi:hypothetical protein